ncbi:serine protease [Aerosakkonemataceae cyanobacterium BLCC-F154]|uniref:Serine protease n=1 Tax=Floridaenema fluviatile BLCC-F154 TaxID=3153640 RepID=A0ABV4YE58_9CYAN
MKRTITLLLALACMYSPIFELSMQASALPAYAQTNATSNRKLTEEEVKSIAQEITVRAFVENSQDYRASGILIDRQKRKQGQQSIYLYLVLTNAHVLKGLNKRVTREGGYRVQTSDNQTHEAFLYPGINWKGNDLGLLWFYSANQYKTANLGKSKSLKDWDKVFVSGFPCEEANSCQGWFTFTSGYAWTWLILHRKHLDSGYQLGFDNDTREGMSGGPVLDERGLVVGINGRGKYQHLGFRSGDPSVPDVNPYAYMDGKDEPPIQIQDTMRSLAWAIPIETYINYVKNPFDRLQLPSPKAGTQSFETQSSPEPSPTSSTAPTTRQRREDEGKNNDKKYDYSQQIPYLGMVGVIAIVLVGSLIVIFYCLLNLNGSRGNKRMSQFPNSSKALLPADYQESFPNIEHIAKVLINYSKKEIEFLVDGCSLLLEYEKNFNREITFSGKPEIKIRSNVLNWNNLIPETDVKEYQFGFPSKRHNDDGSEEIIWYLYPATSVSRKPSSITVTFTSN